MTTKFAYTLSSKRSMAEEAIESIKSLSNWVDPGQIVVYYTPPRRDDHRQALVDLGVDLRETGNETTPFSMREWSKSSGYGEKVQICDIDAETLVFLDCDTIVLDDPEEMIAGDFDFKARVDSYNSDSDEWRTLFQKYGEEYMSWMPNAGCMVFKNRTHQKIKSDWKRYIEEQIELPSNHIRHGEQYALALAVSGYETEQMTPSEHAMRWARECPTDGVVYHGYYPDWENPGGPLRYHVGNAIEQLIKLVR